MIGVPTPFEGNATHPDIRFLRTVTGAFVAPGLLNPRESIAYFDFAHDGLPHNVVLGLAMWVPPLRRD